MFIVVCKSSGLPQFLDGMNLRALCHEWYKLSRIQFLVVGRVMIFGLSGLACLIAFSMSSITRSIRDLY